MTDYTVQPHDTLTKIAKAHNTTISELARKNNITDVNKIEIGQKLIIGEVSEESHALPEVTVTGMDSFQREGNKPSTAQTYAPLAYGLAGAALYQGGKQIMPKVKSLSETAQLKFMYAKDAAKATAKNAAESVSQKSKQTANAVRTFVANKAKHAAKSVELYYAFGKDAVKNGIQNGKEAIKRNGQKAANKTRVAARYTRFVGNTKIAPKLIKGASRYAAPAAAVYGMYEVKQAYDKGGEKAAVRQAVKTGGGLTGGWAGAKVGAAIGSSAGPVGTVVGGIIGGIAGYMIGEKICS